MQPGICEVDANLTPTIVQSPIPMGASEMRKELRTGVKNKQHWQVSFALGEWTDHESF